MVHPDYGPGYDLWVSGGLSTNPMLAVRLGAWVPEVEVAEVWAGVVGLFRDYGYRRLRTRPGSSSWSPTGVRTSSATCWRPSTCTGRCSMARRRSRSRATSACARDGQFFVGLAAVAGRVSGSRLIALADLAETHGQGRLRTTPLQKILVLDVPADQVDAVAGPEALGLSRSRTTGGAR